jgi:hypothetical protein
VVKTELGLTLVLVMDCFPVLGHCAEDAGFLNQTHAQISVDLCS